MSRRQPPDRESGYTREERREREARTVQRERETESRTPVRTTADARPTTTVETRTVTAVDPRSSLQSAGENRESRDVVNQRSGPNPRDAAHVRDPRTGGETGQRMPIVGREVTRDTRTAVPALTRDAGRETRFRPDEIPPRQAPANDYFLPGDGISRDVITADICRYLGPDALVRPYLHQDVSSFESCEFVMLMLV